MYTFEITIENAGNVPADNVRIEDILPAGFVYVEGSIGTQRKRFNDPSGSECGLVEYRYVGVEEELRLTYTLMAPSDMDPGEYCNEAKAEGLGQDKNRVMSNTAKCCTILRRDLSGCCIDIEHWARGFYYIPDLPMAFVDPYFVTEDAMFTVYSSMDFLKRINFGDDSMAEFIRRRLENYSLSTVEEFYLRSKQGLTLGDGSIYLSYGGSYPENGKDGWRDKKVNRTMTTSQVAYELLALNSVLSVNDDKTKNDKLRIILNRKLAFIIESVEDKLIHKWELKKKRVVSGDKEGTFFDLASLYLASVELSNSGVETATELRTLLKNLLKNREAGFDKENVDGELIYVLAMMNNGEEKQAAEKMKRFETMVRNGDIELKTIYSFSMAVYVDFRVGGSYHDELFKELVKKFYTTETGIFSEPQPDFTHRLNLKDLGALILAFESRLPDSKHFFATAFYRMIEETGLFLTKKNLLVENPPLNLLKNYHFGEDLLPMLSFIKGEKSIASVFTHQAVVYSPNLKPQGTDMFPFRFSKILSPSYETDCSKITEMSYLLQHLGNELQKDSERMNREKGRSLGRTGRNYVDSLMKSGSGLENGKLLFIPLDHVALKGPRDKNFNLEPLERGQSFSTETFVNYLIAEKFYISGKGEKSEPLSVMMDRQLRLLDQLESLETIPARFTLLFDSNNEVERMVTSREPVSKLTLAKIFFLSGNETTKRKLASRGRGAFKPEDILFFKLFPDVKEFFMEEMRDLVSRKQLGLTKNSAKLISSRLLNDRESLDPDFLVKLWDDDIALPLTERTDSLKGGVVHHYNATQLMLYIYSGINDQIGFNFDRTLGFFTYLVENEWGIRGDIGTVSLPAAEYWVIKQDPRENPEPGDHISFRVRIENRCPLSLARGKDLPSLFIKTLSDPNLPYSGTEDTPGLEVINEYFWKYNDLNEGSVLEFTYQSVIPENYIFDYFKSTINARGFTSQIDNMPESEGGNFCEDTDTAEGWRIIPTELIKGIVFEDRNANSRRDGGERGIPGILFRDTRGKIYQSDTEGQFIIPSGDDIIGVQINLDSVPSDFLLSSAATFRLNRYSDTTPLFGLIPCTYIQGFVYSDVNLNGYYDKEDKKVGNVVLKAGRKEIITSGEGDFRFKNIPIIWEKSIRIKPVQPYLGGDYKNLKILIRDEKPEN